MARKRRGIALHGWLIIDKSVGVSSAQAVASVRRVTGAAKLGHGGTLDPLASGVLPVALGEATKTVSFVMGHAKTYRFELRWGEARDTDDAEGAVINRSDVRPSPEEVQAVLPRFTGRIWQRPPAFSALKIAGERAYDLARAGKDVTLAPREVEIKALRLLAMPDRDRAQFEAVVGKGTYIRSLARDIGETLGTVAYVTALRRLEVGRFTLAHAISLAKLAELGHSAGDSSHLLPIETALDDIPALALTEAEAHRLRCGQALALTAVPKGTRREELGPGVIVCALCGGKLVALVEVVDETIRPIRVMNL